MGAPSFLLPGFASMPQARTAHQYAEQGFRVLCLVSSDSPISAEQLPGDLKYAGLIVLGDTIREEARDTFAFFAREGVQLKVISGDEALTVSVIAGRAGLDGSDRYIDMSAVPEGTDLREIAEQYTVFGRVSPHAKRELIRALQSNGHTACMTGDGVNDVLALKEAACGVAMIGGSDAARRASDFVLMTSDFSAMIHVLQEGRRVINNIQRVSAMYLVKTMYSTLLSLLYLFLPFVYPFTPIALMPINTLCVGIPTFFLALRPNYNPPEQRFLVYVLRHSLPAALSIVAHILLIQYAGARLGMTSVDIQLCFVMMTGVVCFTLLWQAARPHLWWTRAMIAVLVAAFIASVGCFYWFIEIGSPLNPMNARLYLPLCVSASVLYLLLQQGVIWIDQKWSQWSARKKISKSA